MRLYTKRNGFTLIELTVVFTIIAILSTVGFASFVSYSHRTSLQNSVAEMQTMLEEGRSRTTSQVNAANSCVSGQCQCAANQQFGGYQVLFCCQNGQQVNGATSCPSCFAGDTSEHYELDLVCGGSPIGKLESKKLAPNVSFDPSSTTRSVWFKPLTGLVVGVGTIGITGYSQHKFVAISQTGVLSLVIPTPTPLPSATPTPAPPTPTPTPLPQSTLPVGYFNAYSGNEIFQGWACQYGPGTYNNVDFYDGPGFTTYLGTTTANVNLGDSGLLNVRECASEDHYFQFTAPNSIRNGQNHAIYGYVIDGNRARNSNPVVGNSPISYPGN